MTASQVAAWVAYLRAQRDETARLLTSIYTREDTA